MAAILEPARGIAKALGVSIVGETGSSFRVRAVGDSLLAKAELALERAKNAAEASFINDRDGEPPHWQRLPAGQECCMFDVARGTQEWAGVSAQINAHGFGAAIIKVVRVQHKTRWKVHGADSSMRDPRGTVLCTPWPQHDSACMSSRSAQRR